MSKPKLAVVGLGKLGAPMAAIYSSLGFEVVGVDVNFDTVRRVRNGEDHIQEPGYHELLLKYPFQTIHLDSPDQVEGLNDSDVYFIVVPTPSGNDGRFINDFVLDAIGKLSKALSYNEKNWTIVICSTVMPGSCDGVIKQRIINETYKIPGLDCGLVYSPEFIALGSVIHDMQNPDMVLIGSSDNKAAEIVSSIYAEVTDAPQIFLGLTEAELTKIAINSYITMKISYANSISMLADKMKGVDAFRVCEAIGADGRIGTKYMKPGGPYGGPCFPRDTVAFSTLFNADVGAELVDATKWINDYQIQRAADLIHAYRKLVAPDADGAPDVGILGMSYKPGTHIQTESFGSRLKEQLVEEGLDVIDDSDAGDVRARDIVQIVVVATPDKRYAHIEPFDNQIILDFWDVCESDNKNIVKVGKS